jgi:hypothetical protein
MGMPAQYFTDYCSRAGRTAINDQTKAAKVSDVGAYWAAV